MLLGRHRRLFLCHNIGGGMILGKKIARAALSMLGTVLALSLMSSVIPFVENIMAMNLSLLMEVGLYVVGAFVGGLIFFLLSPMMIKISLAVAEYAENYFHRLPVQDIVIGALGLVMGLVIANLLTGLLSLVPIVGEYLKVLSYLVLGYIGLVIAVKKSDEIVGLLSVGKGGPRSAMKGKQTYKLLDTSAIIDGRILDISRTGFLEGVLVVPSFVLEELRHVADSADVLRRNRGRRGLDVLHNIQKESALRVEIMNRDFDDVAEVDSKLVRLAQQLGAKIITTDYNLNKVCEVQGVPVLNINDLANAVKPMVLPGEEMSVQVMREGKELGQGVAYLDDGTMIVIEQGRRHIGELVAVIVTSALQTSAGRMIFARLK
ncbi:MAG: TRAM domain-containing protein [Peptococcaceae bacterium]|nr:TRAM domain-containing protein [Peptococcaceae bacterium]